MSSRTRSGPSLTSTRTASSSQRPAPAFTVSWKCRSGRVRRAERGGDAALGEEGRGVVEGRLGEQPDAPAARGADGGREAGDTAAQDEHVEGAPVQGLRRSDWRCTGAARPAASDAAAGGGSQPVSCGAPIRDRWSPLTPPKRRRAAPPGLEPQPAPSAATSRSGMPRAQPQISASGTSTKARRSMRGCGSVSSGSSDSTSWKSSISISSVRGPNRSSRVAAVLALDALALAQEIARLRARSRGTRPD